MTAQPPFVLQQVCIRACVTMVAMSGDAVMPLNNKMHAVCTFVSDTEPPGDSSAPN